MSAEKIADKVRTAMVEAWDDATGYESLPEVVAAHLEPVIREREKAAWAAGFKQGGPMHDVNYDDPDAHRRNPYDTKEEA